MAFGLMGSMPILMQWLTERITGCLAADHGDQNRFLDGKLSAYADVLEYVQRWKRHERNTMRDADELIVDLVAALERFSVSDGLCLECFCRLSDDDADYIVGHDNDCALAQLLARAKGTP